MPANNGENRKAYTLSGIISKEGDWYVARCFQLDVVSQGKTIEEANHNILEAIQLYLESFGDDDIVLAGEQFPFITPIEVFA